MCLFNLCIYIYIIYIIYYIYYILDILDILYYIYVYFEYNLKCAETNRFHSYTHCFNKYHMLHLSLFCFYATHNAPGIINLYIAVGMLPIHRGAVVGVTIVTTQLGQGASDQGVDTPQLSCQKVSQLMNTCTGSGILSNLNQLSISLQSKLE